MTIVAPPVQAAKTWSVPRPRQAIVAKRGVPAARPAQLSRPPALKPAAVTAGFPTLRLLAQTDVREAEATSFARRALATAEHTPDGDSGQNRAPAPVQVPNDVTPAASGPEATFVERPVTPAVAAMLEEPSAGEPLDPELAERLGRAAGVPLEGIRVHADDGAHAAAKELGTRAFAFGPDIYLGLGESPLDAEVLAHEVAHVLQGNGSAGIDLAAANAITQFVGDVSSSALDKASDLAAGGAADLLKNFKPYRTLCTVMGRDLLTGENLNLGVDARIAELLRLAGFAEAGPVIKKLALFTTIEPIIARKLREKNLTIERVVADIKNAVTSLSAPEDLIRRFISDAVSAFTEAGAEIIEHVRNVLGPYTQEFLDKQPRIAALWRLATAVFGEDPVSGNAVEASPEQMFADMMILIDQPAALERLRSNGQLASTIEWFAAKLVELGEIKTAFVGPVARAWDAISLENLPQLPDTIGNLVEEAGRVLERIAEFAVDVAAMALTFLKDALMAPLSDYALKIPGYGVIRVLIARDPFTGAKVPAETMDFLREMVLLFSDQDTFEQLTESGKIGQAAETIDAAKKALGISWELVETTIAGVWDFVTFDSLLNPVDTFSQIMDGFGKPIGRIWDFVVVVVREVVRVILVAMGFPLDVLGQMIENVVAAVEDIRKDPVGFLKNIVKVIELGFTKFLEHIGTHLLAGLSAWLLRGVRSLGIEVPEKIDVESSITLVLEVLGVSMDMLWAKIGERIGDKTVDLLRAAPEKLDEVFSFVREVEEGGIGVLWSELSDQLSGLWETVFDAAVEWIAKTVVVKAGAKIVGYLAVPGLGQILGGVDLILSTLQSLIEYAADLVDLLDGYVQTLLDTAKGNVAPGAEGMEAALAKALPMAIGFLATFIGLGDLPEKIKEIILSVRVLVEKAIDWLLDKAVALGQRVLDAMLGKPQDEPDSAHEEALPGVIGGEGFDVDESISVPGDMHRLRSDGPGSALQLHSKPVKLDDYEQMRDLVHAELKYRQETKEIKTNSTKDEELKERLKKQNSTQLQIKLLLEELGEYGALFAPGETAPGIGDIKQHKQQEKRIRAITTKKPVTRIISTESEHVIPFMVGASLWTELLREVVKLRTSTPNRDKAQTTIVIYYRAALIKTSGVGAAALVLPVPPKLKSLYKIINGADTDRKAIKKAQQTSPDVGEDISNKVWTKRKKTTKEESEADLENAITSATKVEEEIPNKIANFKILHKEAAKDLREKAGKTLDRHGNVAIDRTVTAVEAEFYEKEFPGRADIRLRAAQTNGQRRGESTPRPDKTLITKAVDEQKENLVDLLVDTFFGVEAEAAAKHEITSLKRAKGKAAKAARDAKDAKSEAKEREDNKTDE